MVNDNLNNLELPEDLKQEYPFTQNQFETKQGYHLNYVDVGNRNSKDSIVMVHGNPTWSFYYRNLAKSLEKDFRVIVPDHIGCGFSDKPQHFDYSLENHIHHLEELIESLDLQNIHLVVHDWGGAIGMGYATRHSEKIKSIVFLNTAAFRSQEIPSSISICKLPWIGEKIVRNFNAFAWPATFMAVEKRLSPLVKRGYLLPYNNYQNRIATARFVKDIPLDQSHPSYATLLEVETKLNTLTCPKLFLWGAKDFCFTTNYLKRWQEFYPDAQSIIYEEGGHYILEDEKENIIKETNVFFKEHSEKEYH
jgi:cis-3-alkyl-4-acyloxetan-2-one decarboxylase